MRKNNHNNTNFNPPISRELYQAIENLAPVLVDQPSYAQMLTSLQADDNRKKRKNNQSDKQSQPIKKAKENETLSINYTQLAVGSSNSSSTYSYFEVPAGIEINDSIMRAIQKQELSMGTYVKNINSLTALGYNQTLARMLVLLPSSHRLVRNVLKHHEQLIKIYSHEQIVNMGSSQGGLGNLLASLEYYGQLNPKFTTEQIVRMLSVSKGSLSIADLLTHYDDLTNYGLTAEQIVRLVSHQDGRKNIQIILEHFNSLLELNFNKNQIIELVKNKNFSPTLKKLLEATESTPSSIPHQAVHYTENFLDLWEVLSPLSDNSTVQPQDSLSDLLAFLDEIDLTESKQANPSSEEVVDSLLSQIETPINENKARHDLATESPILFSTNSNIMFFTADLSLENENLLEKDNLYFK